MKRFKTIILHIGGEKTGSTRLQHALNNQRETLASNGIHVPNVANMRGNCWGFAVLSQDVPRRSFFHQMSSEKISHEEACTALMQKFNDEFSVACQHTDTLIVSSEHLQTRSNIRGIRHLLAWLAPQTEAIRIVYVTRRQDQILQSLITTILRGNATIEPLLRETTATRLESPRLNHWLAISRYLAFPSISRLEVKVIPYGTGDRREAMDVALKSALSLPDTFALPSRLMNAALKENTMRFMSTLISEPFGDYKKLNQEKRREIVSLLRANDDSPRFLPPKFWAKNVVSPFDASNQRVQDAFLDHDEELFHNRSFTEYPDKEHYSLGMTRTEFLETLAANPLIFDLLPELSAVPDERTFVSIRKALTLS